MESVVEGLLYVQGDLGITLKDIERILEIDEEEARNIECGVKEKFRNFPKGERVWKIWKALESLKTKEILFS